jgi:hypothetical protein
MVPTITNLGDDRFSDEENQREENEDDDTSSDHNAKDLI